MVSTKTQLHEVQYAQSKTIWKSTIKNDGDASRYAAASQEGKTKMGKSKARHDRYKGTGSTVFHMSSEEVTLAKMPYINGYVCRGGVHGDTKYNRRHADAEARRIIDEQRWADSD